MLSPLLERLRPILAREPQPIYLVGGAIRDAFLGQPSNDLDFVLAKEAVRLAFRVGDALGAPAYILDKERDTGRVVLPEVGTVLDFSCFRGPDLEADLRDRDFTINALALPATAVSSADVIDVTGGLMDLEQGRLHLASAMALEHDPVRCLRAVRLATDLGFEMSLQTSEAARSAAPLVAFTSAERVRDELLKMLHNAGSHYAVQEMFGLGLLPVVLPEIAALAEVPQSPPHHETVLAHTVSVLRRLEALEAGLRQTSGKEGDGALEEVRLMLAPYNSALLKHLERPLDGAVDGRHILYLAALFHDVGKGKTKTTDEDGRIHFFGHDEVGAGIAELRLRALCLSNEAITNITRIVSEHMRPLLLAQALGTEPSRRAIYRFFQATGVNGLDVVLLALADHMATYDGTGPQEEWQTLLGLSTILLDHYFRQFTSTVQPPMLVNGRDLMLQLHLPAGPEIGRLLRLIEEGQAAGEISSREEALRFAADNVG